MSSEKGWFVSWNEIYADAAVLADRVRPLGPFKGIVAVTRGGLIPSGLLAAHLDIRHIETLCLVSYENDKTAGSMNVVKGLDLPDGGAGWLVVDDLADKGKTFDFIATLLPNAVRVCLYAKPQGAPSAHHYIRDVGQDTWIFLPWDPESHELDAGTASRAA